SLKEQESMLITEQEAKRKLISQLRKRKQNQMKALKDLRRQTVSLAKALDEDDWLTELKTPFFERRGLIKVPIIGEIVQGYGVWLDPKFRYKLLHKGIFYGAPVGSA